MPQLYLLKFRQPPYVGVSAHWGLFLSYSDSLCNAMKPSTGYLYHATSQWTDCLNLHLFMSEPRETPYERKSYDLSNVSSLFDWWPVRDVDINDYEVHNACCQVSENRGFNVLTKNCQEWVKEVIQFLVREERIDRRVISDMELQGYVTLGESCKRCCAKSLSVSCMCKKNKK
jgi:hypothetical protein